MYKYLLYFKGIKYRFDSMESLKGFYTTLFDHCNERGKLYNALIMENYEMMRVFKKKEGLDLGEKLAIQNQIKNAITILEDMLGVLYDPLNIIREKIKTIV